MKFAQLDIGRDFLLDGEGYVKTGPLTENHAASGKQRLVARSVSVTTAAASAPVPVKRSQGLLERKAASNALTQYHLQCRQILEELAPKLGEATLAAALERMETARRRSLEALAQATDSGG